MPEPRRAHPIDRRTFLGGALAATSGALIAGSAARDLSLSRARHLVLRPERMLDRPASESPIDTIVVVMLENRSFDHAFGWLASDEQFLEAGRRRYGKSFHLVGSIDERYRDPAGRMVRTKPAFGGLGEAGAIRGCDHKVPGHSWHQGRVQRDHGFLARGSGNDEYAVSYFTEQDVPHHRQVAMNSTVLDHYFSSLLGPTFPNRQYLHSAQSEGRTADPGPMTTGVFKAETIWDRLRAAGVPATYYYSDLPLLRLWGEHLKPLVAPVTQYFEQAAAGTLPNVVMVEPSFNGDLRADGHPRGDVRIAAAFTGVIADALLRSPQWPRSLFVVTHDEWGGFYDHVAPVRFADARASSVESHDFGQGGFRVPAAIVSPYAPGNDVDHARYDHTSILRFIEWRFLGAPARGPGRAGARWWLTERDRHAIPIGQTLVTEPVNLQPVLLAAPTRVPTQVPACTSGNAPGGHEPFVTHPSFDEEIARHHPKVTERPWESPALL